VAALNLTLDDEFCRHAAAVLDLDAIPCDLIQSRTFVVVTR